MRRKEVVTYERVKVFKAHCKNLEVDHLQQAQGTGAELAEGEGNMTGLVEYWTAMIVTLVVRGDG